MEIDAALEAIETLDSEGAPRGPHLSNQERIFVAAFLCNGGKGKEAAEAAGYLNPAVIAARLMVRERVTHAIHKMIRRNLHAALPVALGTLVECCQDEAASWKDRRAAAEAILKLDGMGKSTGPTVAVQVNVGKDEPASEVLRAVWEGRASRMSGIAAPMQDIGRDGGDVDAAPLDGDGDGRGWGGVQDQGPCPRSHPIPAPSQENLSQAR